MIRKIVMVILICTCVVLGGCTGNTEAAPEPPFGGERGGMPGDFSGDLPGDFPGDMQGGNPAGPEGAVMNPGDFSAGAADSLNEDVSISGSGGAAAAKNDVGSYIDGYEIIEIEYKKKDTETAYTEAGSTIISFDGSNIDISGDGAAVSGNDVVITAEGDYILRGKLDNGQVIVDAGKEADVRLILENVSIHCDHSSAIYGKSSDKLIITIAEGTANSLSDGDEYTYDDVEEKEPNAVIFSKDDLSVNGEGTLNINASFEHGIRSKDDIKLVSGNINITSVKDGVKGKDSVVVKEASLTVNAGGDGIKSSNDSDETKGYIVIEGGKLNITAALDAIQAVTRVEILAGSLELSSGGGSVNSSMSAGGGNGGWGFWGDMFTSDSETDSAKGIKAEAAIYIAGGTINIDSSDDSLHSNELLYMDGGELTITSGDDGMHADNALEINGGKVTIKKSYEGIEALALEINGGDVKVTAGDDGLNSAGGDGSSMNNRPGMNQFASIEGAYIRVAGGTLYVNASGDGLDSNGELIIEGGAIMVDGPENDGNTAVDHNGTAIVNGGVLVASGSAGMLEGFSGESGQNILTVVFENYVSAGTDVKVTDADGKEVLGFTVGKRSASVIMSSPAFIMGETYTVTVSGEELCSLTIDNRVTDNGVTGGFGGGFGGKGGRGGR